MADIGTSAEASIIILHILPAKIQKKRLEDLKRAATKRKIKLRDNFSSDVTHVVSEHVEAGAVLRSLGLDSVSQLHGAQLLGMSWFVDCMKAGKPVSIESRHRIRGAEETAASEENQHSDTEGHRENPFTMPDYACQRATPLKHFNERFTNALEILERHAELRDGDQDYSRALAFRRASCVLKCLPFTLTNINQLRNLTNIGGHSKRVIQEILEEGDSSEVETIRQDPWFTKMKLFSSVFGAGPSTAKKWIEKDWSTIEQARQGHKTADWRLLWGLAFHEDLTTPVQRPEVDRVVQLVLDQLEVVLPGAIMELTGGFRRGKPTGHDVDILISHPVLGREQGVLPRLLQKLQTLDIVLCGRHEKSTYTDEVLTKDFKLTMRGQLDHFEKWLGIIKLPKHLNQSSRCRKKPQTKSQEKTNTDTSTDTSAENDVTEVLYERNGGEMPSFKESVDDIEPKAKRQRSGVDTELSPLELAATDRDWLARRVDFIVCPYDQYYYALVGWTGNKQFNRDLRWYSQRELGMKLTSHGLYDFNKSCAVPAHSEREVFENLKVTYREPWERNC